MTADDRQKIVTAINDRVVRLLTPYGVGVECAPGTGGAAAEFTFRVPDAPPDKAAPGKYTELVMHLDSYLLRQYRTSAACLDELPLAWARLIADYAPNLFDNAPLPAADEIDWRPAEAVPEDFGAA